MGPGMLRRPVWVAGLLALVGLAAYSVPVWRWREAAAYVTGLGHAPAAAPAVPTEPAFVVGPWLEQAPTEWRGFLEQAERADRLEDPLARCEAFPDLPGNAWPAALPEAHCQYRFGPRLTLARIRAQVDAGRFAELDAAFAADLDRHFSATDFSEAIHRDFDAFDGTPKADQLTQRWVEADPGSPYALAARGLYYWQHARAARGEDYASETPDANFQRMHEYVQASADFYRRALAREPRLMPAYVGQIGLGLIDSSADIQAPFDAAQRIDPGCFPVASIWMRHLSPRWGGSDAQMQAYADTLAPLTAKRPLLTLAIAAIPVDQVDEALRAGRIEEALAISKPAVLRSTEAQGAGQRVHALLSKEGKGNWESLGLALSASRYDQCFCLADTELASLLRYQAHRPDWAVRYFQRAVIAHPEDARSHLQLGGILMDAGQVARAQDELRLALADKETHRDALLGLTTVLRRTLEEPAALATSERLVKEYPADATAWRLRYEILLAERDPRADDARQQFLKLADRNDPVQRATAEALEHDAGAAR